MNTWANQANLLIRDAWIIDGTGRDAYQLSNPRLRRLDLSDFLLNTQHP
jgi:hypothetical protein